ncbi:hypothetical protein JHK85_009050 [Glycine max]|nr:hypothetical protein JHK85_009050 [Glycine max]
MAHQRRRHHYYQRFRHMIPVFSAVAAALFFLFALLSFLAPSPVETDRIHRRRQHTSVNVQKDDAIDNPAFRVPITDAVVAARILNATLVVPKLDQRSFWKDSRSVTTVAQIA